MNLVKEKNGRRPYIAAALLYAAVYFIFYPAFFAFRDEGSYLGAAWLFRDGAVSSVLPAIPGMTLVHAAGRWVMDYPPGQPLLLWLFTWFGWKAAFLTGFTLHLAGAYLFKKIMDLFGLRSFLGFFLYLFFPPFIFFSRTLMSDVPSMVVVLAACYLYWKPGRWNYALAGLVFGLAMLFRPTNLLVGAAFAAVLLLKNGRAFPAFLGAFALGASMTAVWNWALYGNPFLFGRSGEFTGVVNFATAYAPGNALHYLAGLMLCYPLMLPAPFLRSGVRRGETVLAIVLLGGCYLFYYFHDIFPERFATWAFGTRFLFPVMPFFILAYAGFLERGLAKLPGFLRVLVCFIMIAGLAAAAGLVSLLHQRVLEKQRELSEMVYEKTYPGSMLLYDAAASELLQPFWGNRVYREYAGSEEIRRMAEEYPDRDIFVVSRQITYGGRRSESPIDFIYLAGEGITLEQTAALGGARVFRLRYAKIYK